jgi:hypothetical protein
VKTAKDELARRRAAAKEEDRLRKEMVTKIAQGRVEHIPWTNAVVRTLMGERLPDDSLGFGAFSLAEQFVLDRTKGVPVERSDAAFRQALIDLLNSDMPLHRSIRNSIAIEMSALAYPEMAKKAKLKAKLEWFDRLRAEYERRGRKLADADEEIAKALGHESGEALRRWVRDHKHLRKFKPETFPRFVPA